MRAGYSPAQTESSFAMSLDLSSTLLSACFVLMPLATQYVTMPQIPIPATSHMPSVRGDSICEKMMKPMAPEKPFWSGMFAKAAADVAGSPPKKSAKTAVCVCRGGGMGRAQEPRFGIVLRSFGAPTFSSMPKRGS